MAGVLMNWLNGEVRLSRPVTDIERDMSNGFLFGELLHRFNQQPDFDKFTNMEHPNQKIKNFCLLEPVLRGLNIKFDSAMATEIMRGEAGAAKKLIYELYITVRKLLGRSAAKVGRDRQGRGGSRVLALSNMPMRMSKAKFDLQGHGFFERSIRTSVDNQAQVNLATHVSPFTGQMQQQQGDARRDEAHELTELSAHRDDMREHLLYKTRREHDFLRQWQEKGLEEWAYNQQIQKEREFATQRCKRQLRRRRTARTSDQVNRTRVQITSDIDLFEDRLRKQQARPGAKDVWGEDAAASTAGGAAPGDATAGVVAGSQSYDDAAKPEVDAEDAGTFMARLEKTAGDPASWAREGQTQMEVLSGRRGGAARGRDARSSRRREYLNNLHLAQHGQSGFAQEERRCMQLTRASVAEEDLARHRQMLLSHRAVFKANREFRDEQLRDRETQDAEDALTRDSAHFSRVRDAYLTEVDLQMARVTSFDVARGSAAHQVRVEQCHDLMLEVVELSLLAVQQRGQRDDDVHPETWPEIRRLFVAGLSPWVVDEEAGSAAAVRAQDVLDDVELVEYLGTRDAPTCATALAGDRGGVGGEGKVGDAWTVDSASQVLLEDTARLSKWGCRGVDAAAVEAAAAAEAEAAVEAKGEGGGEGEEDAGPPAPTPVASGDDKYGVGTVMQLFLKDAYAAQGAPQAVGGDASAVSEAAAVGSTGGEDPPLRLCVLGHRFTGKSTQARRLADKHGLQVVDPVAILRTQLSGGADAADFVQELSAALSGEMAGFVQRARGALMRGEDVGDDVLVGLAMVAIRNASVVPGAGDAGAAAVSAAGGDNPGVFDRQQAIVDLFNAWDVDGSGAIDVQELLAAVRSFGEGRSDADTEAEAHVLLGEMDMNGDSRITSFELINFFMRLLHDSSDAVFAQTMGTMQTAIVSSSQRAANGFVLDGFPQTPSQCKLLEEALTGYDAKVHAVLRAQRQLDAYMASDGRPHNMEPLHRALRQALRDVEAPLESSIADVSTWGRLVAPPLPSVSPSPDAMVGSSGLDLFLVVDIPDDTVLRRALGRLDDPQTGRAYHIEYDPPSETKPIKSRLVPPTSMACDRVETAAALSVSRKNASDLREWLDAFGNVEYVKPFLPNGGAALGEDGLFRRLDASVSVLLQGRGDAAEVQRLANADAALRTRLGSMFADFSQPQPVVEPASDEVSKEGEGDASAEGEGNAEAAPAAEEASKEADADGAEAVAEGDAADPAVDVKFDTAEYIWAIELAEILGLDGPIVNGLLELRGPVEYAVSSGGEAPTWTEQSAFRAHNAYIDGCTASESLASLGGVDTAMARLDAARFVEVVMSIVGDLAGDTVDAALAFLQQEVVAARRTPSHRLRNLFRELDASGTGWDDGEAGVGLQEFDKVVALMKVHNGETSAAAAEENAELEKAEKAAKGKEYEEGTIDAVMPVLFRYPGFDREADDGGGKGKKKKKGATPTASMESLGAEGSVGDEESQANLPMNANAFVAFVGERCGAFELSAANFDSATTRLEVLVDEIRWEARAAGFEARNQKMMAADTAAMSAGQLADKLLISDLPTVENKDAVASLAARWSTAVTAYTGSLRGSFRSLREHRRSQLVYFAESRRNIHLYLRRPSELQSGIDAFHRLFNGLHQDMRFESDSKTELHQRVSDVVSMLWTAVEGRQSEGRSYLERVAGDLFVIDEVDAVVTVATEMMQSEVDRYHAVCRIVQDYAAVAEGVPVDGDDVLGAAADAAAAAAAGGKGAKGGKDKGAKDAADGDEEADENARLFRGGLAVPRSIVSLGDGSVHSARPPVVEEDAEEDAADKKKGGKKDKKDAKKGKAEEEEESDTPVDLSTQRLESALSQALEVIEDVRTATAERQEKVVAWQEANRVSTFEARAAEEAEVVAAAMGGGGGAGDKKDKKDKGKKDKKDKGEAAPVAGADGDGAGGEEGGESAVTFSDVARCLSLEHENMVHRLRTLARVGREAVAELRAHTEAFHLKMQHRIRERTASELGTIECLSVEYRRAVEDEVPMVPEVRVEDHLSQQPDIWLMHLVVDSGVRTVAPDPAPTIATVERCDDTAFAVSQMITMRTALETAAAEQDEGGCLDLNDLVDMLLRLAAAGSMPPRYAESIAKLDVVIPLYVFTKNDL